MLRASERYRVRRCLASVRMSEEVKGTPQEAPQETEIAEQGTEDHAGFSAGDDSYQQYLAKQELEAWAEGHEYTVYNEQELYLRYDWLEPYFSGHPDRYAIRDDGEVAVIEFKTGPLLEIDYWTDQVNSYYALVAATHQTRGQNPRLRVISKYHGLFQIEPWFPDQTIGETYDLVNVQLKKATLPTPGRWCRYCPARLVCDQAPRAVVPLLSGSELPLGEDGAEVLSRLHVLVKLAKEKIAYYEGLVRKDPKILAGRWKVGKPKRTGEITSITKSVQPLSLFLESRPMLEACAKLSYAKLRDFVVEKKGLTKKEAEAALIDILGELLVFKEGEASVVETVPEQITNA